MDTVAYLGRRSFANRREAGALLAQQLRRFFGREDVVVLAPPRGGVPVGYEVAVGLRSDFSETTDEEVRQLLAAHRGGKEGSARLARVRS